jgi:hypothetical protein
MDEDPRRAARLAAVWALAAFIIAGAFATVTLPRLGPSSDLWDYAQEARQIARGEGFTSLFTFPAVLGHDASPFPVRWRMPLLAGVGALLLKLGIALPAGFFQLAILAHAMLVGLAYILATRLRGPSAGSIAAAVAVACPLLLDVYSPANSQVPNAALHLLTWTLLLTGAGPRSAVLGAVSASAAWYLRGESALMAPLWLWAAFRGPGRPRWGRGAAFVAVTAALCLPWLIALRVARGAVSPVQMLPTLLHTPEFPGYTSTRLYGSGTMGLLEYVSLHPLSFSLRYVKDIVGYGLELLGGLGPIAIGLAIAAYLWRASGAGKSGAAASEIPGRGEGAEAARAHAIRVGAAVLMAVAILWQVLALSALERSPRFLAPVVPLACVLIGVAAAPLLESRLLRGIVRTLLVALLLERGAAVAFQSAAARRAEPALGEADVRAMEHAFAGQPREGVVLSDVPDWVAWKLDRAALFLPMSRDLLGILGEQPVVGVYLSPAARARNAADQDVGWVRAIDATAPIPGFAGPAVLPDGSRLYVRRRAQGVQE